MIVDTVAKVFGTANDRELKQLRPLVAEINAKESEVQQLSDDQLRAKTAEFRSRFAAGETLDDLLPEAFAVVREAEAAHAEHAALRRAADRRHRAPPREDRRDENGRRQDARGDAAGVLEVSEARAFTSSP